MKKSYVKDITITAMMLAVGLVLPIITGNIQLIGNMLLPMHIPVFICALVCGWRYGLPMAFVLPLMRSLLFGMPPLYPTAISMAFELATYAFVAGFLYEKSKWQCVRALYRCLIISMISGRIVWGIVQFTLMRLAGNAFTLKMFLAGALFNAIPGIIIQLIFIPTVMVALDRAKLVPFRNTRNSKEKMRAV